MQISEYNGHESRGWPASRKLVQAHRNPAVARHGARTLGYCRHAAVALTAHQTVPVQERMDLTRSLTAQRRRPGLVAHFLIRGALCVLQLVLDRLRLEHGRSARQTEAGCRELSNSADFGQGPSTTPSRGRELSRGQGSRSPKQLTARSARARRFAPARLHRFGSTIRSSRSHQEEVCRRGLRGGRSMGNERCRAHATTRSVDR
jgi:hypothetical protein